jgi:hypothetical protein
MEIKKHKEAFMENAWFITNEDGDDRLPYLLMNLRMLRV